MKTNLEKKRMVRLGDTSRVMSKIEIPHDAINKNRSSNFRQMSSGIVAQSFVNEGSIPRNLANAGMVLLPTFQRSSSRFSFGFVGAHAGPWYKKLVQKVLKPKPKEEETMPVLVNFDSTRKTFLNDEDDEDELIDNINEQYDLAYSQPKRNISDEKDIISEKVNKNIKMLENKISDLGEAQNFYLESFPISKEQFDNVHEHLLVRKMNIRMDSNFQHNLYQFLAKEQNGQLRRNRKKMIMTAVGLILFIIILIVVCLIVIHVHSSAPE